MEEQEQANRGACEFEIYLQGPLDPRWFHRFEGMEIKGLPEGETCLTGVVADQSALFGILSQIRNIGIPLLEVRRKPRIEKEGKK